MRKGLCLVGLLAFGLGGCSAASDAMHGTAPLESDDHPSQSQNDASVAATPDVGLSGNGGHMPGSPDAGGNGGHESPDASAPGPCGSYDGPVGSTNPAQDGSFFEFTYEGLTRQYKVYVPSQYRNDTPSVVLYMLHGYPGDAELVAFKGTDLDSVAEEKNFVLVVPVGYDSSWNAGSCCGTAAEDGVDDVGFLREVQRRLTSDLGLCIDRSRTYGAGYSNGAFMMYRLACEASDMFAALAGVGGKMTIDAAQCTASFGKPVPLLEVHGTKDWISKIEDTRASIETIASLSGCSAELAPATVPKAELDTACQTFPDCDDGVEVTLCVTENKGHCWYGSKTCGTGNPASALVASSARGIVANEAVWSFVSRFRCEDCNSASP